MKKIIAFDLDGTLSESKQDITQETAKSLTRLLKIYEVAIISGANKEQLFKQLERHVRANLSDIEILSKLYLLPISGAQAFTYNGTWNKVWNYALEDFEKALIYREWDSACKTLNVNTTPFLGWGLIAEDREAQVTFSMLGQEAPLEERKNWDPQGTKRANIISLMNLPEYNVRMGGTTSIDVSKKGVDKAFGMNNLLEMKKYSIEDVMYFGDAFHETGNDFPIKRMGVQSVATKSPADTLEAINILTGHR